MPQHQVYRTETGTCRVGFFSTLHRGGALCHHGGSLEVSPRVPVGHGFSSRLVPQPSCDGSYIPPRTRCHDLPDERQTWRPCAGCPRTAADDVGRRGRVPAGALPAALRQLQTDSQVQSMPSFGHSLLPAQLRPASVPGTGDSSE